MPLAKLAAVTVALAAIAPLLAGPTSAADTAAGSITVQDAWARATAPGTSVGVVYFDIVNSGAGDELLGMESPAARRV